MSTSALRKKFNKGNKMKRKITVTKLENGNRRKPWRVTYYSPSGAKKTRHFVSEKEALTFAAEMGQEAIDPGFAVSLDERVALARLRRQAERAGVSQSSVLSKLNNECIALAEKVIPVGRLKEEFLASRKRDGLRPKTLESYERMLSSFILGHEMRLIADFTPKSISRWATDKYRNHSSQKSAMAPVMNMFRWANEYREDWGVGGEWLLPLKGKRNKIGQKKRPTVATPEEVEALLNCACAELKPGLALMAFAGIRPYEIAGDLKRDFLDWESINFSTKEIFISWKVSKTCTDAILRDLPDNLWAWLDTVPPEKRTGRIFNFCYKTFRRWRAKALKEATGEESWPKDILRHSFATYNFTENGLEHTLTCMRHSNRSEMLWRHYLGDGSTRLAKAYFSIIPNMEIKGMKALAS